MPSSKGQNGGTDIQALVDAPTPHFRGVPGQMIHLPCQPKTKESTMRAIIDFCRNLWCSAFHGVAESPSGIHVHTCRCDCGRTWDEWD